MKFRSRVNQDEIYAKDERREAHSSAVYGIAILSSPSIADSPYENAAKLDMEQLASSILAAIVAINRIIVATTPGLPLLERLLVSWERPRRVLRVAALPGCRNLDACGGLSPVSRASFPRGPRACVS
jgi:hypothetical protein